MIEVYRRVGLEYGSAGTQNARLYRIARDGLDRLLRPGGIALSFGWNAAGFGLGRGYVTKEIMLVTHGSAHNDTICLAEVKLPGHRGLTLVGDDVAI